MCLAFHTELSAGTERRHNKDKSHQTKKDQKDGFEKMFSNPDSHSKCVPIYAFHCTTYVSHRLGLIHAHTHMHCMYKLK